MPQSSTPGSSGGGGGGSNSSGGSVADAARVTGATVGGEQAAKGGAAAGTASSSKAGGAAGAAAAGEAGGAKASPGMLPDFVYNYYPLFIFAAAFGSIAGYFYRSGKQTGTRVRIRDAIREERLLHPDEIEALQEANGFR